MAAQSPSPLGVNPDFKEGIQFLSGNVHSLARGEFDKGPIADAQLLRRVLLVLRRSPEREAQLRVLLNEQQDRSSPNFHTWLTPEQFGKRFGPSDIDIETVMDWLGAKGFTNFKVGNGRTVIEFSGNAASIRNAFHTEIHRYVVRGEEHIANASDPQIPPSLGHAIAGIVSLHNFRKKPMHHYAGLPAADGMGPVKSTGPEFTNSCFDYITGNSVTCHPLGPYDFATIYNVLPLWNAATPIDGTGQTIAIVARTNINIQDISDFRNLFGLPSNSLQVILDGADPGLVPGDETEADLDVEWSGAVAKGATIKLVVSESTETTDGIDLSALYIVDHNLASVMSTSYGQCELSLGVAGNQFYYNLWQQAAAQGITAFVSSGDNGSAGCDFELAQGLLPPQPAQFGLQVNGLGSTPYNVSVGGTDFNDYFNSATFWNSTNNPTTQVSAKGYIPETTWNNSCTNSIFESSQFPLSANPETNCNNPNVPQFAVALGGSGGKSNCTTPSGPSASSCAGGYAKPLWQVAPGVPNDGKRDLPDVSLFASNGFANSFYMMCETDISHGAPCTASNFVGVGGTSASSPAFAGLMALVNQKTGARQGNTNPILYNLAGKQSLSVCNSSASPAPSCVFNDVTAGTIATPCVTGSSNCTTANATDKIGILTGYTAGPGYDLATGLGSVNAANLVNGWNSVAGKASNTSLTLNGGNVVNTMHGTAVDVAVSVSPTPPQPSGFASLVASQGSGDSGFDTLTVTNGSASGTTKMLPGGSSYSVHAHYGGDANYAASDSNDVTVTVSPESSTTELRVATLDLSTGLVANPNAASIPYGSVYVLRGDVTNSSGATCFNSTNSALAYDCPTGTLAFALDGTALGAAAAPLNSEGYAEKQSIQLNVGPHSFAGAYNGDNSYLASSGSDALTVTAAPTITGTQTLFPLPIGIPVGFTVHARSKDFGVFPSQMSGTFAILQGSNQVPVSENNLPGVIFPAPNSPYAWETIDGEITATFSGTPGTRPLTVNYSGDANYAASTSGPLLVNLVYPTQTTLTPSVPTLVDGQLLTVTAQVIPAQNASSPLSGNVVFSLDSSPHKTVAITNGQAQVTISGLVTGTALVSASYSGDSNYGSSSTSLLEPVVPVTTTTSVTSSNPAVNQGVSVTFTATVTPAQTGAAPATGVVQFTANGTSLGARGISNNQAQITTSFSTLGSVQIVAAYAGDTNYSASSGTLTEIVAAVPDFSFVSTGATSQAVDAGQTATFTNALSVSPLNGFSSQVNLTCSLPAEAKMARCSVNPSTLGSGNGSASVVVTTTIRSAGAAPLLPPIWLYLRLQWIASDVLLFALVVLFVFVTREPRKTLDAKVSLGLLSLCLWIAFVTLGCGGGSSIPPPPPLPTGTPAGKYTITVTATSSTLTHTTSLTLIVN